MVCLTLSDNSQAFQNFMKNVLNIEAELCQTHATAIATNNGTHSKYFKDDEKYDKFYEMLCDLMCITCKPAGYYLQSVLEKWLRATPSKILLTLSKILRTLSKILRTVSKILRTVSKILRTLSKILHILPHTQVGLPLYLANMFKAMKASGRELQAQLEKNGTPNRFPKVLPAKKVEWERLQSMDTRTLLASICIQGAREKWNNTVEEICDDGMHIADLLFKLRTVERSINPAIIPALTQKSFFYQLCT